MPTSERHRLSASDFTELAAGLGTAATIAALRAAQFSRRMVILRALIDAARSTARADMAGFYAALDLLDAAQDQNREAVMAVLQYPFVGSWAAYCLRLVQDPRADSRRDISHISCIAAAAAIRAGVSFCIEVPVRDGAVHFPTLGRRRVRAGNTALVQGGSGDTTVNGTALTTGPDWDQLRYCSAASRGQSLTVTLDDLDPFRGTKAFPLASRLDHAAARSWQLAFEGAWGIIARHHQQYSGAVSAGLLSIVPLMARRPNRGMNATARESFGASAMSLVSDPAVFASAIIHEFQHLKLHAILDLVDLYRPDEGLYYAPWRQDPRPLGGLLHGAYAYLGVTDFWRVQRAVPGTPHAPYAEVEFARWSDRVRLVIDTLLCSGSLTKAGVQFVHGMQERQRQWSRDVAGEPSRLAQLASLDHHITWRLRNAVPDAATIGRLTDEWLAGESAPQQSPAAPELAAGQNELGESTRLDLMHLKLRDPGACDQPAGLPSYGIDATAADLAFASGDFTAAALTYGTTIRADPRNMAAWAGLALALHATDAGQPIFALVSRPELVYGLHNEIVARTGQAPDPVLLSAWLAPAVPAGPGR